MEFCDQSWNSSHFGPEFKMIVALSAILRNVASVKIWTICENYTDDPAPTSDLRDVSLISKRVYKSNTFSTLVNLNIVVVF